MPPRSSPRTAAAAALLGTALTLAAATAAEATALAAPTTPAKPHGAKDGKSHGGKASTKGRREDKKSGPSPAATATAKESRAAGASAAPESAPEPPRGMPALALERVTLDNGLRIVLSPSSASPTVALAVTYDAGSRLETRGQSGVAGLLERLMFQGSKNIGPGEHARLVEERGGVATGTADENDATFIDVLPAGELALGLFLEADRMKGLALREESLLREREAIERERQARLSGLAFAPSALRLRELVYQGYFPYEHPAEGAAADLASLTLASIEDFHAHRYGPGSAVLTITGDFDPREAESLVRRYFDGISKIDVAPPDEAALPEQTSQRTAVMRDPAARAPAIFYGFAIPAASTREHHALDLAAIMLGGGESSRLYQSLIRERAIAGRASAETHGLRGPDLFSISVELGEEAKVGDVEKLIEGEIKALATTGPSDAELDKARRQMQSRILLDMESSPRRAALLGAWESRYNDARMLEREIPAYLAVSREDVKRAVSQHLGPTRRSIVEAYPASALLPKGDAALPKGASAAPTSPGALAPTPSAPPSGARKGGKAAPEHKPKKGAPAKAKKPRKEG